jgi:protocatechuate 3,4-dioxygenase beta subunit
VFVVASAIDYAGQRRCYSADETIVDAEGRYAFRNLPPGPYILLAFDVTSSQSRPPRMSFTEVRPGEETVVDFASERGRIRGRLADAQGLPLARFPVSAFPADGGPDATAWQLTLTGADGAFTFAGLPPGEYELHVARPERVDKESVLCARVRVPSGAEIERDLVLPEGAVHGRVVDESTGEPVDGALAVLLRVDTTTGEREFAAKQTTGADGRYVLPFLSAGGYDLVVLPYGGRHAARRVDGLRVQDGAELEQDVALALGGSVELVVKDEQGRAVQGASVDATCGQERLEFGPFLMTDEQGFVAVPGLSRGACSLAVRHPRFETAALTVHVDTGVPSQHTVVLARSH